MSDLNTDFPVGFLSLLSRLYEHERANRPELWSSTEWRLDLPVLIELVADDLRGDTDKTKSVAEMVRVLERDACSNIREGLPLKSAESPDSTLGDEERHQLKAQVRSLTAPAESLIDWAEVHGYIRVRADPADETGIVGLTDLGRETCLHERVQWQDDKSEDPAESPLEEEIARHPIWQLVKVDEQSNLRAHVVMRMFRRTRVITYDDLFPMVQSENKRDDAQFRARAKSAVHESKLPSERHKFMDYSKRAIETEWPGAGDWISARKAKGENPERLILRDKRYVRPKKKKT